MDSGALREQLLRAVRHPSRPVLIRHGVRCDEPLSDGVALARPRLHDAAAALELRAGDVGAQPLRVLWKCSKRSLGAASLDIDEEGLEVILSKFTGYVGVVAADGSVQIMAMVRRAVSVTMRSVVLASLAFRSWHGTIGVLAII